VNSVLMRMIALDGHFVRNVMDIDCRVNQNY